MSGSYSQLLEGGWTRLVIGAAIAMLSAQVMVHHAGLSSLNGLLTLASGGVIWAFGMTLTIKPIGNEIENLAETIK